MHYNWGETFWWTIPNIIVPLLTIPIVMFIQWLSNKQPSWQAIIEDGQVCFFSIALLAASWYDLKSIMHRLPIESLVGIYTLIFLIGALAALGYGIMASDHQGAKMLSRARSAGTSVVIGLASIGVATYVHSIVAGAHH